MTFCSSVSTRGRWIRSLRMMEGGGEGGGRGEEGHVTGMLSSIDLSPVPRFYLLFFSSFFHSPSSSSSSSLPSFLPPSLPPTRIDRNISPADAGIHLSLLRILHHPHPRGHSASGATAMDSPPSFPPLPPSPLPAGVTTLPSGGIFNNYPRSTSGSTRILNMEADDCV